MKTISKTIKYTLLVAALLLFRSQATVACDLLNLGFTYSTDSNDVVTFTNTSIGYTSFTWDFGDGTTESSIVNPQHFYASAFNYVYAKLNLKDTNNCEDSIILTVFLNRCDTSWLSGFKTCDNTSIKEYYSDSLGTFYAVIHVYGDIGGGVDDPQIQYYKCNEQSLGECGLDSFACTIINNPSVQFVREVWSCYPCDDISWLLRYHAYSDTMHDLKVHDGGWYDPSIESHFDGELISRAAWGRRGFVFFVYDSNTGTNWQTYQIGNTCRGPFNDITCGIYPTNVIEFVTRDIDSVTAKLERQYLKNFLDSIPCNAFVMGYSFFNAGYSQWASDSINPGDITLFKAFENFGVTTIRQQQDEKPFVFFLQKCNPSFTPIEIKRDTFTGIIDTTFRFRDSKTTNIVCKNQSINEYLAYGEMKYFEVVPLDTSKPKNYYRCDGSKVGYCGLTPDTTRNFQYTDSFCNALLSHLQFVRNVWFCSDTTLCDTTTCMLPGDADHDLTVNNFDVLAIGLSYNRAGSVRANATTNYVLQHAPDWSTIHDYGFNDKFSDCNGDGIINESDIPVIDQNYIIQAENIFHYKMQQDSLPVITLDFDTVPGVVVIGDCTGAQLTADIIVGDSVRSANNEYGIAFSVNYPFDSSACFNVTVETDTSSWFQTHDSIILFYKNIPQYRRVDIAIVRTDGNARSGAGKIGAIKLITEGDIFGIHAHRSASATFDFSVTNAVSVNNIGVRKNIIGSDAQVNFLTVNTKQNTVKGLKIFPNPANSKIFISASEEMESLRILDIAGKVIYECFPRINNVSVDLSAINTGLYFLEIKGKNTSAFEKFVKQ